MQHTVPHLVVAVGVPAAASLEQLRELGRWRVEDKDAHGDEHIAAATMPDCFAARQRQREAPGCRTAVLL